MDSTDDVPTQNWPTGSVSFPTRAGPLRRAGLRPASSADRELPLPPHDGRGLPLRAMNFGKAASAFAPLLMFLV